MNKKNKILLIILIIFILAIIVRVLTSQDLFVVEPEMKVHGGVSGCIPMIVDHIAVNDNVYFAQTPGIMYLVDTNRRLISHLNTELEDFTRHIYSDTILFDKGDEGSETMTLNWIDGNTAEFYFEYKGDTQRSSCAIQVEEQWASPAGVERFESE